MLRKFLAAVALAAVFSHAFAAVDANTANEDALRGIRGIGPAKAKALLDERAAHGPFKDAADLAKRVKGFGGQTVEKLQNEGLTIGPANAATNVPANVPVAPANAQSKAAPVKAKGAAAPVKK